MKEIKQMIFPNQLLSLLAYCRKKFLSEIAFSFNFSRTAFVGTFYAPMRNLHYLEDSVLIDLLAEYTLKFTHLFRIYKIQPNKEYQNYKRVIEKIIGELNKRGLIPKKDEASPSNEGALSLHS